MDVGPASGLSMMTWYVEWQWSFLLACPLAQLSLHGWIINYSDWRFATRACCSLLTRRFLTGLRPGVQLASPILARFPSPNKPVDATFVRRLEVSRWPAVELGIVEFPPALHGMRYYYHYHYFSITYVLAVNIARDGVPAVFFFIFTPSPLGIFPWPCFLFNNDVRPCFLWCLTMFFDDVWFCFWWYLTTCFVDFCPWFLNDVWPCFCYFWPCCFKRYLTIVFDDVGLCFLAMFDHIFWSLLTMYCDDLWQCLLAMFDNVVWLLLTMFFDDVWPCFFMIVDHVFDMCCQCVYIYFPIPCSFSFRPYFVLHSTSTLP
jgi:hypothetical protein